MTEGKLVIISGPSAGVGKDTIVKMFLQKHPDWHSFPSVTTRRPRSGESDGKDYFFTDRTDFEQKMRDGEFLETFVVSGKLYGTLKKPIEKLLEEGKNVILRKEVNGALNIKKELPAAITIFLTTDNFEELRQRIESRKTDSQELIEQRLGLAKEELGYKNQFDEVIVNPAGHPERALEMVEKAAGLLSWHS